LNSAYKYKSIQLIVKEGLLDDLGNLGIKHFPNEFGGFLIGKYSEDFKTLYLTDYLLPKKYKGFPFLFERYIDGLVSVFKNIFREKKEYYIGEWHTHPNGSTMFSQTDLNAMNQSVECDSVKIKNPVLLIISVTDDKIISHRFYYYNDKKLMPYE